MRYEFTVLVSDGPIDVNGTLLVVGTPRPAKLIDRCTIDADSLPDAIWKYGALFHDRESRGQEGKLRPASGQEGQDPPVRSECQRPPAG